MKFKRAAKFLVASLIYVSLISTPILAQSIDPTPTPSPSESASPQISPSPSPSTSPSPSVSPETSKSPAAVGASTKSAVLGNTTELGQTSSQKEIAKWVIGALIGLFAFIIVIKTVRSAQE